MKQSLIIGILLVVLCGVTFLFIHVLLSPVPEQKTPVSQEEQAANKTQTTSSSTDSVSTSSTSTSAASPSSDSQSNPSQGPFPVLDADGNDTGAVLSVLRSPEEVLVQFKNFSEKYGDGSRLYLAKDLEAKSFIDLGPARLNYGVLLYDIPLDTDTSVYRYIGIFSTSSNKFSYYVKLQ